MNDNLGASQVVGVQSFLSSGLDLKKLLRDVSKQSRPAVEALVDLLNSPDDKVKLSAATALLKLNVDVATAINEDALKRLIAETKVNGGSRLLTESSATMTPLVDFANIRSID